MYPRSQQMIWAMQELVELYEEMSEEEYDEHESGFSTCPLCKASKLTVDKVWNKENCKDCAWVQMTGDLCSQTRTQFGGKHKGFKTPQWDRIDELHDWIYAYKKAQEVEKGITKAEAMTDELKEAA